MGTNTQDKQLSEKEQWDEEARRNPEKLARWREIAKQRFNVMHALDSLVASMVGTDNAVAQKLMGPLAEYERKRNEDVWQTHEGLDFNTIMPSEAPNVDAIKAREMKAREELTQQLASLSDDDLIEVITLAGMLDNYVSIINSVLAGVAVMGILTRSSTVAETAARELR